MRTASNVIDRAPKERVDTQVGTRFRGFTHGAHLYARGLAVALAVAMGGCASTNYRDESAGGNIAESMAEGAVKGAGAGLVGGAYAGLACGPFVGLCVPYFAGVGLVAGTVGGAALAGIATAVENAKSSRGTTSGRDTTSYSAVTGSYSYVGELPASDFSPPGSLLVAKDELQGLNDAEVGGSLLVNLDKPPDGSRRSIKTDIAVTCPTGQVNYMMQRTYHDWNASGQTMAWEWPTSGIAPGPQLDAVVREVCSRVPIVARTGPAPAQPAGAEAQDGSSTQPASEPSNTSAESLPMPSAQNADQLVMAEAPELPGTSETPVNTAGRAQESEVAAPAPVALAAPTETAAESPKPVVTGLPTAGTSWIYEFADRMYRGNKTSVTVNVIRVDNAANTSIQELVTTGTESSERVVRIGDSQVMQLPLGGSALLVEVAPYLLAGSDQGASLESQSITGYPQGPTGLTPWRIRVTKRGWEQVRVSAGGYRALRVEIDGERERQDVFWGQDGRFSIVAWYALEVKRLIKLEHKTWETSSRRLNGHWVLELTSFSPPS